MGQPYNLFDFSRGVVSANVNPLDYPQNAVRDGRNVDLQNKGLKTRKGWTVVGEVVSTSSVTWEIDQISSLGVFSGSTRTGFGLCYDTDLNCLWLYAGQIVGGAKTNELWKYESGTWTLITPIGSAPAVDGVSLVYSPITQSVFAFGGNLGGSSGTWEYVPSTNTWTEKSAYAGGVYGAMAAEWLGAVYRDGSAYCYGGEILGAPVNDFFKYNCSTDTWETISLAGPLSCQYHSLVYDATGDCVYLIAGHTLANLMTSGYQNACWRYSFGSGQWEEMPSPVTNRANVGAVWHPGADQLLAVAGFHYEVFNSRYQYEYGDPSLGSGLTEVEPDPHIFDAPYCRAVYGANNVWVVGSNEDTMSMAAWSFEYVEIPAGSGVVTAPITRVEQVRFPTNMSSYILAQAENGSASELYVSDSQLPSSTASFTKIKDLAAGSNPLSIAVLNDRCILAEQHNNVQVFAGCRSATGADWAVPKQVFATENGTDHYDLGTAALCDSDDDTTSELGSWPTAGSVLINCDMKTVAGFYIKVATPNGNAAVLTVERYVNGTWTSVSVSDGTASGGASLAQTGVITWTAASSDYQTIAEVPGFWWRLRWSAQLSAGTELTRVLYKAAIQDLQNIAANTGDKPIGFLYYDYSDHSTKDYSVEAVDSDENTVARLCRSDNSQAMGSLDYIYVGYYTPFMPIEITPGKDTNNVAVATMNVSYWNGTTWTAVSNLDDGTEDPVTGVTLSQKGKITFTLPTNWKENRPISRNYPQAYWVRIGVSGTLANPKATSLVAISEARVYSIPLALKKYKFCYVLKDRLILVSRSDAPNQCSMSRSMEEYGFSGDQSKELMLGAQDIIICAIELYNQGWIGKANDMYMLNGMTPETWAAERAETGHQVPLNNQCLCPAHIMESDGKAKMGMYYLNGNGLWHFTGLQAYLITKEVNWFDENSDNPKVDKNYLHKACGVYWPDRNWLVWSVPMLFDDAVSQTTNNAILVYDLTLQAWLPPFVFSGIGIASLCVAFAYSSTAASKLGGRILLAGTYDGRVVRLFDGDDDNGTEVSSWIETGHLHMGEPDTTKEIRTMRCYGKTDGNGLTVESFVDGEADAVATKFFSKISAIGTKAFAQDFDGNNVQGNFIKLKLSWSGQSDIYGVQLTVDGLRGELAT